MTSLTWKQAPPPPPTHCDWMAGHELGGLHGLAVVGDPELHGRRLVAAQQLLETQEAALAKTPAEPGGKMSTTCFRHAAFFRFNRSCRLATRLRFWQRDPKRGVRKKSERPGPLVLTGTPALR